MRPLLVLMLVSLMSVTLEPKEAKVTPLFSKDLPNLPGKEGLMPQWRATGNSPGRFAQPA